MSDKISGIIAIIMSTGFMLLQARQILALRSENKELKTKIKEILEIVQDHVIGGNIENIGHLNERLEKYECCK